jgi:hypothetical protein
MTQQKLDLPLDYGPLFGSFDSCPECGAKDSCFCREEIRGLSFWQPFGTLMFYDKIETRKWSTKYRGLVLICTTKKQLHKQPLDKTRHIQFTKDHEEQIDKAFENESFFAKDKPTIHLNGFAIGLGRLYDCRNVWKQDMTYFEHTKIGFPIFAHVYTDVRRIEPFPVKGSQGWFKVTPEMKAKIKVL